MNNTIDGAMSHSAYALLAQQHRPTDADTFAREAKRLAGQGLRARDIGVAINLTEAAVIQLLNQPELGHDH